jgi:hypothetical protein
MKPVAWQPGTEILLEPLMSSRWPFYLDYLNITAVSQALPDFQAGRAMLTVNKDCFFHRFFLLV